MRGWLTRTNPIYLVLLCASISTFSWAQNTQPSPSASLALESATPLHASAVKAAYEAYLRRDASEVLTQALLLPKDHVLRPWVQGWVALVDPASAPDELAKFARKFPPSSMRGRLLEEAAVRHAKASRFDLTRIDLAEIPPLTLGPQARCAASLAADVPLPEVAVTLLAAGSGSELCSAAAVRGLLGRSDSYGAALATMTPSAALAALGSTALSADPASRAGQTAALRLLASGTFDPAWPLTSRETVSRQVATSLGSGQCTAQLHEPDRLTLRGKANAARCALWTGGPVQASLYWRALAREAPTDPRWEALLAATDSRTPSFIGEPTSYFALTGQALWGSRAPEAQTPPVRSLGLPAGRCQDMAATLSLALWSHGARREAVSSWGSLLARSDAPTRACLGTRADAAGAHPLRIAAFAGGAYDSRAYAPGFDRDIRAGAQAAGLSPELAISLARQESRFDETALSRVGAAGLFQLMPPTAREVATQLLMQPPDNVSLLAPALNSRLGTTYLAGLMRQFDGDAPWALCAYNAGASRCKGWRTRLMALPPIFRIEAIPYDETRLYIERVMVGWSLTGSPDVERAAPYLRFTPGSKAKPLAPRKDRS